MKAVTPPPITTKQTAALLMLDGRSIAVCTGRHYVAEFKEDVLVVLMPNAPGPEQKARFTPEEFFTAFQDSRWQVYFDKNQPEPTAP